MNGSGGRFSCGCGPCSADSGTGETGGRPGACATGGVERQPIRYTAATMTHATAAIAAILKDDDPPGPEGPAVDGGLGCALADDLRPMGFYILPASPFR